MKIAAFLSILSALATAFLLTSSANANLALPSIELSSQLAHEEVEIKITGNKAEVTGTFKFAYTIDEYHNICFFLPVYAKEGTPMETVMPDVHLGEEKLKVHHIAKRWQDDPSIQSFGKLPEIEGQIVYWFMIPHVPQAPAITEGAAQNKEVVLKIRYTQQLAGDKFIYTPLIPKQQEGKDYGSITVSADRPLTLLDADKHSVEKSGDKFVVDPSDKRAIVVQVANLKPSLP